MFCPQCGSNQSDELKFCKACGSNLQVVRQFLISGEKSGKIDWSKTWLAEMFLSHAELDRLRGVTPEIKRANEVKAGVITSSVGLGIAIFLWVFMDGIILGTGISQGTAYILSRLWIAGVIPFLVGLGLIFNGVFVSKKLVKGSGANEPAAPLPETDLRSLRSADTTEFAPRLSVTEGTTKHLGGADRT